MRRMCLADIDPRSTLTRVSLETLLYKLEAFAPPPVSTKGWTRDALTALICMRDQGVPDREIAACLGKSINAVYTKAHALRIPKRPTPRYWTEAERQELRREWLNGVAGRDLARKLGRAYNVVMMEARKLDLPPRIIRHRARGWVLARTSPPSLLDG